MWFAAFAGAYGWLYRLHSRWFAIARERFDAIHCGGMAVYKIGVLLMNLVPLLALQLMGY